MSKKTIGTKIRIGLYNIAGLTSITPPNKTADMIEKTTLDDPYRKYVATLKDGGEVAISGYFEAGDTNGQLALDDAFESGEEVPFEIIFPAEVGASWSFGGLVQSLTFGTAELGELLTFEATIKVSGKPDLNTTASTGLSALSLTGAGGTLSPAFSNSKYFYTFGGVTASSVTVTATAAGHTLKLFMDGEYSQDLTSGSASTAISLTLNVGKKLTIVAQEEGKSSVIYEVVVVKTA